MYRVFAVALAFAAVACGGGSASGDPTATSEPSGASSATQQVAGERTQTPVSPTAEASRPGTYEVAEGDTLSDIAARFDTTVEALVAANGLANADELTVGQVLQIVAPDATPAASETPAASPAAQ